METLTLTKKEYTDLLKIRKNLDEILNRKTKKSSSKKDNFLEAFGVFKKDYKEDSVAYVNKLRKEWRK